MLSRSSAAHISTYLGECCRHSEWHCGCHLNRKDFELRPHAGVPLRLNGYDVCGEPVHGEERIVVLINGFLFLS